MAAKVLQFKFWNDKSNFLNDFTYLFLERGEGREKDRERNINVWLPLLHHLLGTCLQPRHVPWLGIGPATLCFAGRCSIHWATPAIAKAIFLMKVLPGISQGSNHLCLRSKFIYSFSCPLHEMFWPVSSWALSGQNFSNSVFKICCTYFI